jgi:butyryl-CoA dehydrogenase
MIADMAAQIHAARLLTYNAARNRDKGSQVAFESSAAKLFASEMVSDVAIKSVQIHGGYGYCKGFKVERLFRDQKIMSIFEGSSEVQRMVISGLLLS